MPVSLSGIIDHSQFFIYCYLLILITVQTVETILCFFFFLSRVITSHLQTFGSTLVVGKALDKVNLVMFLCFFLFLLASEYIVLKW